MALPAWGRELIMRLKRDALGVRVFSCIASVMLVMGLLPLPAYASAADALVVGEPSGEEPLVVEEPSGEEGPAVVEEPSGEETDHIVTNDMGGATIEEDVSTEVSDATPAVEGGQLDEDEPPVIEDDIEFRAQSSATDSVIYIERSWDASEKKVVSESKPAESAAPVPDNGNMTSGWYYLDKNIKVDGRINLEGNTHLILCDGCKLDVKGIYVPKGSTFSIYAQSDGEDAGKIYSHPSSGAGIGAKSDNHPGGNVVIHGGNIEAEGHDHCAGIGGNDGDEKDVGDFTMYGGTVDAEGGSYGAGIGGGQACEGGKITIYDGTVTAVGDTCGAGIGGGNGKDHNPFRGGHAGTITIWGGTIIAKGGNQAAGIGGGEGGNAGKITINGGIIIAKGGKEAAGIGCGEGETTGMGGTITINGGNVTATAGDKAAGIGGGYNTGENYDDSHSYCDEINIAGGTIIANGSRRAAAIGAGAYSNSGNINISGGKITANPDSDNGIGIGSAHNSWGSTWVYFSYNDETRDTIEIMPTKYYAHIYFWQAFMSPYTGESFGTGELLDKDFIKDKRLVAYRWTSTTYREADGTEKTTEGIPVREDSYIWRGGNNTFIVDQDVDLNHQVELKSKASITLILNDGCTLRVNNIRVEKGCSLTIYGQDKGTGTVITAPDNFNRSGIGGAYTDCGTITINGGTVRANGGSDSSENKGSAGIGAAYDQPAGTVNINGGTVVATGGVGAQGIGGTNKATGKTNLSYTDYTRDKISVKASSYDGTVTLAKPFISEKGVFDAGTQAELGLLAGSPLRAWTGEAFDWESLQGAINGASDGATITLGNDVFGGSTVKALHVASGKNVTIDLNGHTIDRGLAGGDAMKDGCVIKNEGTLTIKDSEGGGKITGGNSTGEGGGIYDSGTLTIEGGSISGNKSAKWGGGVYLSNGANVVLNLNGGSITNNTCKSNGGGVHVSEDATMNVSGSPVVSGNKKGGDANNVNLAGGTVIQVTGALADGAEMGVSRSQGAGSITGGYSEHNSATFPETFFQADNTSYVVALENGEAAIMAEANTVTVTFENDEDVTFQTVAKGGKAMRPVDPTRDRCEFSGWYKVDPGTSDLEATAFDFNTPVNGDITLRAKWDQLFSVAVYTSDEGFTASVADASVDPLKSSYKTGDSVTVTAPDVDGWELLGWYPVTAVANGLVTGYGDRLSTGSAYSFDVNRDTSLVAVYQPEEGRGTLTIVPRNGAEFTVGGESDVYDWEYRANVELGSKVTLAAKEADKVLSWENESGKVLGTGASLDVLVWRDMTITLRYKGADESQSYVEFLSDYGQVLKAGVYDSLGEDDFPDPPAKMGYKFVGWVFEGGGEATAQSLADKIGTVDTIVVKPKYEKIETTKYTLTVSYLDGDDNTVYAPASTTGLSLGDLRRATAPEAEGFSFDHCEDADKQDEKGNNITLGYGAALELKVQGDMNLVARYVTEGEEVTAPEPVITIGQPVAVAAGDVHKVAATATRDVPKGYALVEQGVLYARDVPGLDKTTFVYGTEGVGRFVSTNKKAKGTTTLNVKVDTDDVRVSLRGYMVVKETKTGEQETYYTTIVQATYNTAKGQG